MSHRNLFPPSLRFRAGYALPPSKTCQPHPTIANVNLNPTGLTHHLVHFWGCWPVPSAFVVLVAEVVESCFVPAWKPYSNLSLCWWGIEGLKAQKLRRLSKWIDERSAPRDLCQHLSQIEYADTWTLGQPDYILEFEEDYMLSPVVLDV